MSMDGSENEALQRRVVELEQENAELRQKADLYEAELLRAEEREALIAAQQAALAELSTPLIPLAEGVIAMPIVGAIDSGRAQRIMEALLEGISFQQAETAILDITGVRVVDTQVADALLRAAQAAKLLGARVVLTGISAEVAQAIVHLGANLGSVVTRSNLQSGIAYALDQE
jgi:rsbT co-antagonist protein RsbR